MRINKYKNFGVVAMNIKDALRTLLFKEKKKIYHQLYTEWGEQLDTEHVWEEYPRPQLKRNNYTILNGYWNYSISKIGKKPLEFEGKILVPFSPESILSGVGRQLMPDEYLWYERTFLIHKKFESKRCILQFGAVDQFCEVFINNKKVAEHMGGYLPFSIDITKNIKEGENVLTLRVIDWSDTSYHSRGKQKLKRGGMFYTAQSGIWQTVWMEWVPDYYIHGLKITPLVDQSAVQVELQMNRPLYEDEKRKECTITILADHKLIQSITSPFHNIIIPLEGFEYWSPENPFLYDMVITIGEDKIETYFAMRKYEIKKDEEGMKRIFLNNEPYFQNGLLDQGYWPDGLYTAPCDEAFIFDIEKAKELGFNMLRKHLKIEPLRWYYHCDRLGMIVWQDMVNGGSDYNMLFVGYLPSLFPKLATKWKDKHYGLFSRKSKIGRIEWRAECKRTVELLYNCPSVAVWVPFNEGWGQFDALNAVELIRSIDKYRYVDHASGWFDQKGGDFKSIHDYFHKLDFIPDDRVVVLSEFGGYACYIPDHSYSWQIYGYRIFISKGDLDKGIQKLYQEEVVPLIHKGLAATVYTQLSDVEDEVNGLFTYDRKVCKVSPLKIETGLTNVENTKLK